MKKIIITMILIASMVVSALANPTVTIGRTSGYYGSIGGGEFTVTPNSELIAITAETGPFQSFCMEVGETVIIGNTYNAVVNDKVISGGVGPAGDPISSQTAYLYSQFRNGTLTGYNYTPGSGRAASADNLQAAFWYLENETGYTNFAALSSGAQSFVTLANANATGGIGDVRVLNLVTNAGNLRQDVLVLVSNPIPAPGAIMLGGIGACLVGWLRKRRTI